MMPVQHVPAHAPPRRVAAPPRPPPPFTPWPPRAARPAAGADAGTGADAASAGHAGAWRAPARRSGGEDGGGMAASAGAADAAHAELDHYADALAGLGADDGVFAVTLADGRTLDVALQRGSAGLHFLLGAADAALSRQLRRHRMELQRGVQRRMSGTVTLTVL